MRIRWADRSIAHRWIRPALSVGFVTIVGSSAVGCGDGAGIVSGEGTLSSTAGSVSVQCIDRTKVQIVGFQPAAGYTARMIVEGPAGQVSLVFENPNANDYRVGVHCTDSEPILEEFEIEDTTLTD
jgi:hypothetical protein